MTTSSSGNCTRGRRSCATDDVPRGGRLRVRLATDRRFLRRSPNLAAADVPQASGRVACRLCHRHRRFQTPVSGALGLLPTARHTQWERVSLPRWCRPALVHGRLSTGDRIGGRVLIDTRPHCRPIVYRCNGLPFDRARRLGNRPRRGSGAGGRRRRPRAGSPPGCARCANSAIISVTSGPIMWTPRISPVFASAMILTWPSSSPSAWALPFGRNGALPTLISRPPSRACASVLPIAATCG